MSLEVKSSFASQILLGILFLFIYAFVGAHFLIHIKH